MKFLNTYYLLYIIIYNNIAVINFIYNFFI